MLIYTYGATEVADEQRVRIPQARSGPRVLTKLPAAFCGGSDARVDPVPMVKPAIRSLNLSLAVHVDIEIDRLTDGHVA